MAGEQELILELFKDGKEYSTSEVVNAIYADIVSVDPSLNTKAKLHRKLIYHLNKLVDNKILRVSSYKSKGEKVFRAARDLIIDLPHNKVVISNKELSLKGLEQEDSVIQFKPFGIMINSLMINAISLDLSNLSTMLKDLYKEVNDVIAILNIEHLLASSSIDELNNFFSGITKIINDRKLSLLINYKNPKAHYLGKAYSCLKNNENIEVILMLREEDFLSKTKELVNSIDALKDAGLKINISVNSSRVSFSGNGGAYTTRINDEDQSANQFANQFGNQFGDQIDNDRIVSVVSTNTVCVDIAKIKALPAKKIKELLMKITKGLHHVNAHQQLESEKLFPIIKSYGGKITRGKNSIRFWNYNWKTDEQLLNLIEEIKEEREKGF